MSETKNFFRASAEDFKKIPGSPVAYWMSEKMRDLFSGETVKDFGFAGIGMRTGDNARFLRLWHEVSGDNTIIGCKSKEEQKSSGKRWVPYNKGGEFRKWFGNNDYLVNWKDNGIEIKKATLLAYPQLSMDNLGWKISNESYYFRKGITWSGVTSGTFSCRCYEDGFIFDSGANGLFAYADDDRYFLAGVLNTDLADRILKIINPTINTGSGTLNQVPVVRPKEDSYKSVIELVKSLVAISKTDWDAYETSWDFANNPLVDLARRVNNSEPPRILSDLYANLREKWAKDCEGMRRLEMENNRIFIEAYGFQDELTPEVPWQEITLTCNPFYRYGVREVEKVGGGGDAFPLNPELEERLKADTVKELISYGVGCMMGRYSLAKPGLILADQGSTIADYWSKVGEGAFSPDDDGIIPVLDDDCFADDIVTQFEKFLVAAFGAAQLGANRAFIEQALGKDLRSYFVKDFYADHLQRYQKRPIYWLFSSPKGTFNALVYLHRYQPNTAGQVLGYLRSFITKLQAKIEAADKTAADPNASQSFRTRAIKERTKLARQLKELEDYEREVLHPLSLQHVALDLDDGVKVNYLKLGAALKKIHGLEAKE